jgi:hypothetical protein
MRDDSEYKAAVEGIAEIALDFAESALMKNIKAGKEASNMFYLKCRGKRRGYVERQEIEHSGQCGVLVVPGQQMTAEKWAAANQKKKGDPSQ